MTNEKYDGIWRPERLISGAWVATRYTQDLDLNQPYRREEDIITRNGVMIANYVETMGQCEKRCNALNEHA